MTKYFNILSGLWIQIRFAKSRAWALFWTPSQRRSCQKVRWDRFGIMIREVVWTTMCESGFPGPTSPAILIDCSGMCCSLSVEIFLFMVPPIYIPDFGQRLRKAVENVYFQCRKNCALE